MVTASLDRVAKLLPACVDPALVGKSRDWPVSGLLPAAESKSVGGN